MNSSDSAYPAQEIRDKTAHLSAEDITWVYKSRSSTRIVYLARDLSNEQAREAAHFRTYWATWGPNPGRRARHQFHEADQSVRKMVAEGAVFFVPKKFTDRVVLETQPLWPRWPDSVNDITQAFYSWCAVAELMQAHVGEIINAIELIDSLSDKRTNDEARAAIESVVDDAVQLLYRAAQARLEEDEKIQAIQDAEVRTEEELFNDGLIRRAGRTPHSDIVGHTKA